MSLICVFYVRKVKCQCLSVRLMEDQKGPVVYAVVYVFVVDYGSWSVWL